MYTLYIHTYIYELLLSRTFEQSVDSVYGPIGKLILDFGVGYIINIHVIIRKLWFRL